MNTAQSTTGDQRYEQILREAQHLIRERGFASVSIRDLASAVGIKVPSLYYYFDTKNDILYVLMMRTMEALLDRSYKAVRRLGSSDPAERLGTLVDVGVLYHIEHQTVASMALTEVRNLTEVHAKEVRVTFREYTDLFVRTIQDGIDAGDFHVEDSRMAAFIILSGLTRISLWYDPGGRLGPAEMSTKFQRLFLQMLGHQGGH